MNTGVNIRRQHNLAAVGMSVTVSIVLTTVLISPVAYLLYRFALFVFDVRRRGKAVNQFPGGTKALAVGTHTPGTYYIPEF